MAAHAEDVSEVTRFPRNSETTARFEIEEPATSPGSGAKRDRGTLTVLSGPNTGGIFTIEGEIVFGRGPEASARIVDQGLSRRHARLYQQGEQFFLEDLSSTNGTFANGRSVRGCYELREGDRIQLGPNVLLRFHLHDAVEQEATKRLYELAVRDSLTGAHNRRYLDERLATEHAFAARHGTSLTVILLDIDHFKAVNDRYGHLAGDAVLRVFAATLRRILRTEDLVARYGGEEFAVVARDIDKTNARIVAERLRSTVAQLKIPFEEDEIRVTTSCGVATLRPGTWYETASGLVAAADAALYRAKSEGRNRTIQA